MQIPKFPFLSGPGILHQPQSGSRQQVNTELQVKAQAQPGGGPEAARPANSGIHRASGANTLEEAVRTLAADGRLPRRGSLVDLKI